MAEPTILFGSVCHLQRTDACCEGRLRALTFWEAQHRCADGKSKARSPAPKGGTAVARSVMCAVSQTGYEAVGRIVWYIRAKVADLMEVFPGISMNPDVRFGKPCIAGTRMDVATVVGLIAAGETIETVVSEYQLSVEQVRAALAYAAHVAAHVPPAVRQAS